MPQLELAFIPFCASVVLIYWVIPPRWRRILLAISSSLFLAFLDPLSFAVLAALTALVYLFGRHPESKIFYGLCLAAILLLFCGIRILQLLQKSGFTVPYLVLVGYGFYALKLIHYAVETRSRKFRSHNFLDFYNYMSFFPTITIGPIHRFEDFLKSERRIRWNDQDFANGLERLLYGYAKVIVIANWLVAFRLDSFVDRFQPNTSLSVFAESMIYGFYLYFSFAGYSDVAIGVSLLLGYRICENFHYPFLKRNIGEFWQSWHMSLSSWCRQYVFLPIFARWRNLPVALIGAMLAIGLWHEFSLRFFLWGIYHGCGLLIWRTYQKFADQRFPKVEKGFWFRLGTGACIALTFVFVMVGFTIPRSESIAEMILNFQRLARL
jgi:alginate O-acetyltransferase complex protein AlgI